MRKFIQRTSKVFFLSIFIPVIFILLLAGEFVLFKKYNIIFNIPFITDRLSFLTPKFVIEEVEKTKRTNASVLENLGMAPELEGISYWFNSAPLTLSSFRGRKPVLITFGRNLCSYCLNVYTYMTEWERTYGSEVAFIAVHSPKYDEEKNLDEISKALKSHNVTFPVALDIDQQTSKSYKLEFLPATFLIDTNGLIRFKLVGESGFNKIEDAIIELIGWTNK